jgi:anti-sigma B factor antagonist
MVATGSFEVKRVGSDGQFSLHGELDMATAEHLLAVLEPVVQQGGSLTLDLSELAFLDSSGIHAIHQIGRQLGGRGWVIILRSPSPAALRVLEIVGAEQFAGVRIELGDDGMTSRA